MSAVTQRISNLRLIPSAARPACFILEASKGSVRAARTLVSEEIKRVIGKHRWMPACYVSSKEMEGSNPRIVISITDEECEKICSAIHDRTITEDWSLCPIDVYHD